jgi:hypothetical protein
MDTPVRSTITCWGEVNCLCDHIIDYLKSVELVPAYKNPRLSLNNRGLTMESFRGCVI